MLSRRCGCCHDELPGANVGRQAHEGEEDAYYAPMYNALRGEISGDVRRYSAGTYYVDDWGGAAEWYQLRGGMMRRAWSASRRRTRIEETQAYLPSASTASFAISFAAYCTNSFDIPYVTWPPL
jgi:hypothetical protein